MDAIEVLATLRFTDDLLDQLREVSPRLKVTQQACHNAAEVADALSAHPDTEILYGFHLPADALDRAPGLRWG